MVAFLRHRRVVIVRPLTVIVALVVPLVVFAFPIPVVGVSVIVVVTVPVLIPLISFIKVSELSIGGHVDIIFLAVRVVTGILLQLLLLLFFQFDLIYNALLLNNKYSYHTWSDSTSHQSQPTRIRSAFCRQDLVDYCLLCYISFELFIKICIFKEN